MKKFFIFFLLAFVLMADFASYAQTLPGDESGGGGGLQDGDPPPAPINTQLIILVILGIAFVFNMYRLENKKA
ncbi:hypothetical protein EZL74_04605 [Flavobacterium silvisoli]|uniref:Signal peptidase n=1 Tax=Flavobacterium silvisoli TaxID=2529433 RepID=A0A4Q9Z8K2_9FLAO|nr:hypothetical protein [Flavobacterium silvisoli]TBX70459.1 hypothetical protein EZL74_04605 [Flavobacterium silvisoli]